MSDLMQRNVSEFLALTASDAPAPGGGSVSALAGALSAALVSMVARLSQGDKFAAVCEEMRRIADRAQELCARLAACVEKDTDSFNEYMAALRLPKTDEAAIAARREAMQAGLKHAARVPLETAQTACEVFPLARLAASKGNANAQSDALVAAMLARAAVLGAVLNVRINLGSIRDSDFCAAIAAEANDCVCSALQGEREVLLASALSADLAAKDR